MIQHLPQTLPRNKPMRRPVNRITEGHVIGRHAFGNGPGGSSSLKKPARHLLPRPNLRNRPVVEPGMINLPCFLLWRQNVKVFFHTRARLTQGFPRTQKRQGKRAAGPA